MGRVGPHTGSTDVFSQVACPFVPSAMLVCTASSMHQLVPLQTQLGGRVTGLSPVLLETTWGVGNLIASPTGLLANSQDRTTAKRPDCGQAFRMW